MNLSSVLKNGNQYFGDKTALIFENRNFSYEELNACVDQAAFHL